jgi:hypothetical protein
VRTLIQSPLDRRNVFPQEKLTSKSLFTTRPTFYRLDEAIRGDVSCSLPCARVEKARAIRGGGDFRNVRRPTAQAPGRSCPPRKSPNAASKNCWGHLKQSPNAPIQAGPDIPPKSGMIPLLGVTVFSECAQAIFQGTLDLIEQTRQSCRQL